MLYIAIVIVCGLGLMVLERLIPDQELPAVKGWWPRVLVVNIIQISIVILAGFTWDKWLTRMSLFNISHLPPYLGGFISYFIITFVFYWWHRLRHDNNFLWLLCHQLHHSPSRIETITSFFKHPAELILDSIIVSSITYFLLGLSLDGAGWVTIYTALGEMFYHMNIKTPQFIGYFFQRPEMHRIHHERGRHYDNFSDLPIWDMLFGTFQNPAKVTVPCGYKPERESRFWSMMAFRNVNSAYTQPRKFVPRKPVSRYGVYALLTLGMLQTVGFVTGFMPLRGIGMAMTASPLPLVFSSFRGLETFTLNFDIKAIYPDKSEQKFVLDNRLYSGLEGPYNLRNVYGAAFAYGAAFSSPKEIAMRDHILRYAFCSPGTLVKVAGLAKDLASVELVVTSKREDDPRRFTIAVDCQGESNTQGESHDIAIR